MSCKKLISDKYTTIYRDRNSKKGINSVNIQYIEKVMASLL